MKIGIRLPQGVRTDLRHDVTDTAIRAEAIGYTSVWTFERLLFPVNPAQSYPAPGYDGQPWPESQRQVADPLVLLTAAAAVTTRVRLGTAVLVAPAHAPFSLAKTLATMDQISGGRMICGLGTGWSADELQATGATRADRGRFLNEMLDVADAVWGPDPVNYRSPRLTIDDAYVLPKPVRTIPVLLGGDAGGSQIILERIARRADGWLSVAPFKDGLQDSFGTWNRIRDAAAAHGRDAGRMEHIVVGNATLTERPQGRDRVPFVGTLDEIAADVATAAQHADEVIVDLNLHDSSDAPTPVFTSTAQMLDTAEELHHRVTRG